MSDRTRIENNKLISGAYCDFCGKNADDLEVLVRSTLGAHICPNCAIMSFSNGLSRGKGLFDLNVLNDEVMSFARKWGCLTKFKKSPVEFLSDMAFALGLRIDASDKSDDS